MAENMNVYSASSESCQLLKQDYEKIRILHPLQNVLLWVGGIAVSEVDLGHEVVAFKGFLAGGKRPIIIVGNGKPFTAEVEISEPESAGREVTEFVKHT